MTTWRVIYHHEVADDLEALGRYAARAVLKAIEERIRDGAPDQSGNPLAGELTGTISAQKTMGTGYEDCFCIQLHTVFSPFNNSMHTTQRANARKSFS